MCNFHFGKVRAHCMHGAKECKTVNYSRSSAWAAFLCHLRITVPVKMYVFYGEINLCMDTLCWISCLLRISGWNFCVMQCMCVFVKPDLQLKYLIIPCSNTWSQCLFNYCVWHTNCVGTAYLKGKSFKDWAGPGQKPNVALGVNVMIFSTENV